MRRILEAKQMTKNIGTIWHAAAVLLLFFGTQLLCAQETIVAIRHGEKPPGGLGQLSCAGLNRSMALPTVLTGRFGKPNAIYAPSPAVRIIDGLHLYSYARPLATIEPTAISFGMPVNTQIGWNNITKLQSDLTSRKYRNSLIFVAWEHAELNEFAERMLRTYGQKTSAVPKWPDDDYDRLYIFKLDQKNGKTALTFTVDHEGLNTSIKDVCQPLTAGDGSGVSSGLTASSGSNGSSTPGKTALAQAPATPASK